MKVLKLISPFILLIFTCSLMAQSEKVSKDKLEIKLESTILDETRTISINLPNDYSSSDVHYPVLYLLDGKTHFGHAGSAVDYLSSRSLAPGIIVVSIHNIDRSRDFSPRHVENIPTSGGAEKFLGFVSEELMSYMNDNFRTSGFDMILGHSFGGTFVAYTMIEKPELFDGIIAVSPYLHFADSYIIDEAEKGLHPYSNEKYFFMSVGDEANYFDPLARFSTLMKEKTDGTVNFKYMKMESENHGTTPYLTLFYGLRYIFSDWQFPRGMLNEGLEAIDAHFASLSEKYGFEIQTPEIIINALGYAHLGKNEIDKAIVVFEENVKRYPKSANVYDSLGEALEKDGQIEKAAKYYQEAVDIGKKKNDPNTSIYKKNLKRVMDE